MTEKEVAIQRDLCEAVEEYRERFGVGPPIWGLSEEEAVRQMKEAIRRGRPMKDDYPPGVVL